MVMGAGMDGDGCGNGLETAVGMGNGIIIVNIGK